MVTKAQVLDWLDHPLVREAVRQSGWSPGDSPLGLLEALHVVLTKYDLATRGDESRLPEPPADGELYSSQEVWTELAQGTLPIHFEGRTRSGFNLFATKMAVELLLEGQSYRKVAESTGLGTTRTAQIRRHILPFLPPPMVGGAHHHRKAA